MTLLHNVDEDLKGIIIGTYLNVSFSESFAFAFEWLVPSKVAAEMK